MLVDSKVHWFKQNVQYENSKGMHVMCMCHIFIYILLPHFICKYTDALNICKDIHVWVLYR